MRANDTTTQYNVAERVELLQPTDRVRGTVTSVSQGGIFVVKYDDGSYVAYGPEDLKKFTAIPDKPIPRVARYLIAELKKSLGQPPSDTSNSFPRQDRMPPMED